MHLIFIRHGQSEGNVPGPKAGRLNPGLTPLGIRQANHAGERIAKQQVNALYCGPLRRGLHTAAEIFNASGVHPVLLPPLFEIGGNKKAWEKSKVEKWFPMVRTKLQLPAGQQDELETWAAAIERARRVVAWICGQYVEREDAWVYVVGHGRFNQVMTEICLGMTPRRDAWLTCGNCAFHWLELRPGYVRAHKLNDESHIPTDERSGSV
ncbi:MAG TPA: histidine phosphatase family protein [Candidatus Hydrogenedentes bacterium]|nr:histidine phosphatase family protein [Candidatus Hydrogenedentota bacterium]HPG68412.1 histidine phosphatase family protein [Candidatus Hydrogenedentota bacterium]